MFFHVFLIVLIPLICGILLKNICKQKVEPIIKIFPAISTLFITFICSLVIALNRAFLPNINLIIFIAVLILNISGLTLGYSLGYLLKFDKLKKLNSNLIYVYGEFDFTNKETAQELIKIVENKGKKAKEKMIHNAGHEICCYNPILLDFQYEYIQNLININFLDDGIK